MRSGGADQIRSESGALAGEGGGIGGPDGAAECACRGGSNETA